MSANGTVRKMVERIAHDEVDETELLNALGIVDEEGSLLPDDTAFYHISDPSKGPGVRNPTSLRDPGKKPANMTTPPGLATLPPIVADNKPKVVRNKPKPPPKPPKEAPACGQYKAYSRHRYLG